MTARVCGVWQVAGWVQPEVLPPCSPPAQRPQVLRAGALRRVHRYQLALSEMSDEQEHSVRWWLTAL